MSASQNVQSFELKLSSLLLLTSILLNNENGQTANLYHCFGEAAKAACRASKVDVFRALDAFIEEHSGGFVNFKLNKIH